MATFLYIVIGSCLFYKDYKFLKGVAHSHALEEVGSMEYCKNSLLYRAVYYKTLFVIWLIKTLGWPLITSR